MKKDNIKKIISKAHSAFDGLSMILLSILIFFVVYIGILRLIGPFSETAKAIVVIGIPLAVLVCMVRGFRQGGKTRRYLIYFLIGFVSSIVIMRALRYLVKMF
jgi:hypothetical protein